MRFLILMATMLALTGCTATLSDARPTAAPPQQSQPQVINAGSDDVVVIIGVLLLVTVLIALACALAFVAGYTHRAHQEHAQLTAPPQPPQIVVISESMYRQRLPQADEVSHER